MLELTMIPEHCQNLTKQNCGKMLLGWY